MRPYFIVEGSKTEPLVWGAWLAVTLPGLSPVRTVEEMEEERYFMVEGGGYPSYLDRIEDAVAMFNASPGTFDQLIICTDTEDMSFADKQAELREAVSAHACPVASHILLADCCIETWFLGNRAFIHPNATSQKVERGEELHTSLSEFMTHYNVRDKDPENMPPMDGYRNRADLCVHYFDAACRERHTRYTKRKPTVVMNPEFLAQLIRRHEQTGHIPSFGAAWSKLQALGARLPSAPPEQPTS